jgi:hypothetical protein
MLTSTYQRSVSAHVIMLVAFLNTPRITPFSIIHKYGSWVNSFQKWQVITVHNPGVGIYLLCRVWLIHNIVKLLIMTGWKYKKSWGKVKQSHYRHWEGLRIPRTWSSQILNQSAHEDGKVVSPTHRPTLPQDIFLVLISVRGWVDPRVMVWPEGLCQWKNPVTPSGIEPATLRFVAQCLNHYATACPQQSWRLLWNELFRVWRFDSDVAAGERVLGCEAVSLDIGLQFRKMKTIGFSIRHEHLTQGQVSHPRRSESSARDYLLTLSINIRTQFCFLNLAFR